MERPVLAHRRRYAAVQHCVRLLGCCGRPWSRSLRGRIAGATAAAGVAAAESTGKAVRDVGRSIGENAATAYIWGRETDKANARRSIHKVIDDGIATRQDVIASLEERQAQKPPVRLIDSPQQLPPRRGGYFTDIP